MNRRFHLVAAVALFAGAALPIASHAQASAARPPMPAGVKVDPEKENQGKLAATGWITLLDRRDWGGAWERSSTLFRKNVPLGTWMDNVPKLRERFGNFAEREVVSVIYKTTLAGHPDGDYVTVSFVSKFSNKPNVQEMVLTVREPDGRWRVTGYSAE